MTEKTRDISTDIQESVLSSFYRNGLSTGPDKPGWAPYHVAFDGLDDTVEMIFRTMAWYSQIGGEAYRCDLVGFSESDVEKLTDRYPTLMRSCLMNRNEEGEARYSIRRLADGTHIGESSADPAIHISPGCFSFIIDTEDTGRLDPYLRDLAGYLSRYSDNPFFRSTDREKNMLTHSLPYLIMLSAMVASSTPGMRRYLDPALDEAGEGEARKALRKDAYRVMNQMHAACGEPLTPLQWTYSPRRYEDMSPEESWTRFPLPGREFLMELDRCGGDYSRCDMELLKNTVLADSHGYDILGGTRPLALTKMPQERLDVYNYLATEGSHLFRKASRDKDEHSRARLTIHIALLGLGAHNTELLKALPWFLHADRYRLEIDVYSRDPEVGRRLEELMPEIMGPEGVNGYRKNDVGLSLDIRPHVSDRSGKEFYRFQEEHGSKADGHMFIEKDYLDGNSVNIDDVTLQFFHECGNVYAWEYGLKTLPQDHSIDSDIEKYAMKLYEDGLGIRQDRSISDKQRLQFYQIPELYQSFLSEALHLKAVSSRDLWFEAPSRFEKAETEKERIQAEIDENEQKRRFIMYQRNQDYEPEELVFEYHQKNHEIMRRKIGTMKLEKNARENILRLDKQRGRIYEMTGNGPDMASSGSGDNRGPRYREVIKSFYSRSRKLEDPHPIGDRYERPQLKRKDPRRSEGRDI